MRPSLPYLEGCWMHMSREAKPSSNDFTQKKSVAVMTEPSPSLHSPLVRKVVSLCDPSLLPGEAARANSDRGWATKGPLDIRRHKSRRPPCNRGVAKKPGDRSQALRRLLPYR